MDAADKILAVNAAAITTDEVKLMDGPAASVVELAPADSSTSAKYTPEFVHSLRSSLLNAAQKGFTHVKSVMPARKACQIIDDAILLFKAEPTLIEVHR